MFAISTLNDLLRAAGRSARGITYLEGDNDEKSLSFAELEQRALGILHHLQKLGAKPGDKLILLLASNEAFIDGFWAAVLGGIVPVPVAAGISDEHRHKLLRIARQLGNPFIYTDRKTLTRMGRFATQAGAAREFGVLQQRAFLVDDLDDISRAGTPHRAHNCAEIYLT